jgi:hypothetical protein
MQSKYLKKLGYVLEKKHIRRMKRSRKVCPIDSTDIEWDYLTESLDFAETHYRDVPVMAYGVPKKERVSFWKG